MGTPCPYQHYFSGWLSPLIFKYSKRALDFSGGRSDHYHFCGMSALCFEDQRLKINLWFLSRFQTIKASKWPFASAAGLCDPHLKRMCGEDENHPLHTSTDQRVKMTLWFCICRFHDQRSNLDHWFSSYQNDNLISYAIIVIWYQVVKMTTWIKNMGWDASTQPTRFLLRKT